MAKFLMVLLLTGGGLSTLAAQTTPAKAPVRLSAEAQARFDAQRSLARADKAARTPAQNKVSSQLLFAAREETRGEALHGVPTLQTNMVKTTEGLVRVEITADVSPALLDAIKALGGTDIESYPKENAVIARLPLPKLEILAQRGDVHFINPVAKSKVGAYMGEGVKTHRADYVQNNLKVLGSNGTAVTGANIKVGVVSDSDDHSETAITSHDLPDSYSVIVDPNSGNQNGRPATGEGSAMMEVVHEMAPDAQLYFATGASSELQMARNIRALQAQGCKVIIDDEYYFNESPFHPSVIDQAIRDVCNQGVLYFSCAYNNGNLDSGTAPCWEGDYVSSSQAGSLNWGGDDHYNKILSDTATDALYLHWTDNYGSAADDYDLYLFDDNGNMMGMSNDVQSGTGNPVEHINGPIAAGLNVLVELDSGSSRFLHVSIGGGKLTHATAGSVVGHNAAIADNAFSVAATPASNFAPNPPYSSGPYPNAFDSTALVEIFSCDGPRRRFYDDDGHAFTPGNFSSTGGKVFNKPDITAADGVKNSHAYTAADLYPFFGTSCAAPHAGAIAALIMSYAPTLTPAQVASLMRFKTLDIMAPGWDRDSGYGIVMPELAIKNAGPVVSLTPTTRTFNVPLHSATATQSFSLQISDQGPSTLNWTLSNGNALLSESATQGTIAPGKNQTITVTLNNAQANTLDAGSYLSTLIISDNSGVSSQSIDITLNVTDTTAPEVAVSTPQDGSVIQGFTTVSGTANDAGGIAGNVVNFDLYNVNSGSYWSGTGWSSTPVQLGAPYNPSTGVWTWNGALPSAANGTLRTGPYTLSAFTTDAQGNQSPARSGVNNIIFTVDNSPPTLSIDNPVNGSTITALSGLSGLSIDDTKTGGVVDVFLHRLADNSYWNGAEWIVFNGTYPVLGTAFDGTSGSWSYNGSLPYPGSSPYSNLTNGSYEVIAVAADAAGNQSQVSSYFTEDFAFVWTGATLHDTNPNNDSNSFNNPSNWFPASVPGPNDKAVIANGDSVDLAGDHTLRAFVLGSGVINNYTITVTGAGSGFSGGQMSGTTLNVQAGATLTIDTSGEPYLNSAILNNAGTVIVLASNAANPSILDGNGATINNLNGAAIQIAREGTIWRNVGNPPSIINAGTITKTAGSGTTDFGSFNFTNQATGSFGAATGALLISNGAALANGSRITGPGSVILGSTVAFTGQTTITADLRFQSAMTFNAATLVQGAGGRLRWDTGAFGGTFTIPAGTKLEVDTSGEPYLNSATLNNAGTITISASNAANPSIIDGNSAVLNNQNGGVIQIARDGLVMRNVGNLPNISNAVGGTIVKTTAAGGRSEIDWSVDNNGTIQAGAGTLALGAGSTAAGGTGAFTASVAAARVEFAGGQHILKAGARMTGVGKGLLTGGELTVSGAASVGTSSAAAGGFVQSGGTLDGTGSLSILGGAGACAWSSGVISTTFSLGAGATLAIDTSGEPYLNSATLNNAGTITISASNAANPSIIDGNSAVLNNQNGGVIQIARDGLVMRNVGNLPNISNAVGGTIVKTTAAGGRSEIDWSVDNNGTIQAGAGTLALGAGSTAAGGTGAFTASVAAARVEFAGGQHILKAGARMTGAGQTVLSGGELTLSGATTIGTATAPSGFTQTGGVLDGTGSLTALGGVCHWSAGSVSTTYTVNAGATLAIDTAGEPYLNNATLINSGTITIGTSNAANPNIMDGNASMIGNLSGGVIQITREGAIWRNVGNPTSVVNAGTITKTAGTGTTDLGSFGFTNAATGSFGAASGTLLISNGVTLANGSRITGPGSTVLGSAATFTGQTTVTGDLRFQGGMTFNAAMLVQGTGGRLRWDNSAFAGTLTIPAATKLEVDTSGSPQLSNVTFNNSGTLAISASSATSPGSFDGNSATLNNQNGGVIQLGRDGAIFRNIGNLPVLNNLAGGTVVKTGGTGTTDLGSFTLDNRGTLSVPAGKILLLTNGMTVSAASQITGTGKVSTADLMLNATLSIAAGTTLEFGSAGGTLTGAESGSGVINGPGTFHLVGQTVTGKLGLGATLLTALDTTNNPTLSNAVLNHSGTMTVSGGAGNLDGTSATFNNLAGATIQVVAKTALRNVGNLPAFVNSGTVRLGPTPEILTMGWTFTQASTGILDLTLAGTTAATPQFSQVDLEANAVLGGTLQIDLASTYRPPNKAVFPIISYATKPGTDFAQFTQPNVPTGTVLTRAASATGITITANLAPVITSALTATVNEESAFSYQIVAANSPTSYGATGLPTGLTVSTTTGKITGTPTVPGVYTVVLSATNSFGKGTANLVLTVKLIPPVIISALTATGNKGSTFSYQTAATHTPTSYAATGLPTGLSINTSTGLIGGTSTGNAGTYSITLTATNSAGSGTAKLTLTLHAFPVITSALTATGNVGSPFTYQITATNSPTSYGGTGLPTGLSIAALTGKITGTPTISGTFHATITAYNGTGTTAGSGSATLVLTVKTAPVITSATTAAGNVGSPFSYQITTINTPTSYSATGLPAGLSISSSTGKISGTPTKAGTYAVTLAATNASGSGSAKLTITVTSLPVITSATTAAAKAGVSFTYQITATNTPTSYSAAGLPTGLSIVASTGRISGTPTKAGTYTVALAATNASGTGKANLTITVAVSPPVITSAKTAAGKVGTSFSYQIVAGNTPTGYTAAPLPAGLKVSATGLISGTPTTAAATAVTITASNTAGKGTATLTVTISKAGTSSEDAKTAGKTWPDAGAKSAGTLAPGELPEIISAAVADAQIGKPFSYQIAANVEAQKYAAKGLPAGLEVDPATGLISGTPSELGVFKTRLTTQVGAGTLKGSLTLTVTDQPVLVPVVTSALSLDGLTGVSGSYQIAATNHPTSFGAENLPEGLSVNAASGIISGMPTAAGVYPIVLNATNAGGTGSAELVLTVTAPPLPVVTATATVARTSAVGTEAGRITLTIPEALAKDLIVTYEVAGTAVNGTDYRLLKGTSRIKAGRTEATIAIIPQGTLEGAAAAGKVVEFALEPSEDYAVGTSAPVKVEILPGK